MITITQVLTALMACLLLQTAATEHSTVAQKRIQTSAHRDSVEQLALQLLASAKVSGGIQSAPSSCSEPKKIHFDEQSTTLGSALDQILPNSGYKWREARSLINIEPTARSTSVLDVLIDRIQIDPEATLS